MSRRFQEALGACAHEKNEIVSQSGRKTWHLSVRSMSAAVTNSTLLDAPASGRDNTRSFGNTQISG